VSGQAREDGEGDAELDAILAAADRELLEAIKGAIDLDAGRDAILREIDARKLPGDAAMRRIYREMDEQEMPGDPPFDAEAGLRDLEDRLREDAASFSSGAASLDEEGFVGRTLDAIGTAGGTATPDIEALIEASSLGTPAAKALRAEGRRMLYGDTPPDMDRIHAIGEELAAGRITAGEAYGRFLEAGCLPAGARLHVRLRGGQ